MQYSRCKESNALVAVSNVFRAQAGRPIQNRTGSKLYCASERHDFLLTLVIN